MSIQLFRLNVYHRVRVTLYRVFSKPVKVTVQIYPSHSRDESPYYLFRMTQTGHLFLCSILPRDPDYVTAGKYEFRHLDASREQISIEAFGLLNYFCQCSIVSFCQFSPHGFGQILATTRLIALYLFASLSTLITSLCQNENTYRSWLSGLWAQPG